MLPFLPDAHDLRALRPRDLLAGTRRCLAEVVRDGLPLTVVQPWLDALPVSLPGPMDSCEARAQDLLVLAMTSRRVALLDAVLRSAPFQHPGAGQGLPFAVAHPDPTVRPWEGTGDPWLRPMHDDPLTERIGQAPLPRPDELEVSWRLLQHHQPMLSGFRAHSHLNLLGFGVMLGWHDGIRALVEHGASPYARADGTSEAHLLSPVLLAVHHQDPQALVALLAHPALDPFRTFGPPDNVTTSGLPLALKHALQHRCAPHRLELGVVLDDPTIMAQPSVRAALGAWLARWEPMLHELDAQLIDPQRRRLETVRLHHVAQEAQGAVLDERARSRL